MSGEVLSVRYRRDPVIGTWREIRLPRGLSLADIAERLVLEHPALRPHLAVRVGGHLIHRKHWRGLKPFARSNDGEPVFVDFEVQLGKGRTVFALASIALIGASIAVSAGALAPAWGTAFAAGGWGARFASGALAIGGALAMQNLLPSVGAPDELGNTPLGVAGSSLTLKPGAPLPYVLGSDRAEPEPVIQPYNTWLDQSTDKITYVGAFAGEHQLSGVRSGEIGLEGAADTEIQIRQGLSGDTPISFLEDDGTIVQQNVGIALSRFKVVSEPGFGNVLADPNVADPNPLFHRVQTSGDDCDRFRFMYLLPSFVYHSEVDGDQGLLLPLRHRMRLVGAPDWIPLPDLYLSGLRRPLRAIFDVEWVDALPGAAGNAWNTGENEWAGVGWLWLRPLVAGSEDLATGDDVSGLAEWKWEGWKVTLYLLKSLYPKGAYEFEVKRGWSANTDDSGPDSHDYFVIPVTGIENPMTMEDDVNLAIVQSHYPDEYPIAADTEFNAYVAIRRTNAQLDVVTCLAASVIESAEAVVGASANPGRQYWWVLAGPRNSEPVPVERINFTRLVGWEAECAATGRQCNMTVRGEKVSDVLKMIALTGQARPIFAPIHSVAIDRLDTGGMRGLITKRNARFLPVQLPFALRPHALSATFRDAQQDYRVREITQFADGYNADGSAGLIEATRYETQDYRGFSDEALLRERMLFDLRWLKFRAKTFSAVMDIEHFELEPGMLMGMSNDFLGTTHGDARVKQILTSGSNITGFILDEIADRGGGSGDLRRILDLRVVPDLRRASGTAGAAIRLLDGTVRVEELADIGADLTRIDFATPFAMPTSGGNPLIVEGTLLTMGSLANESRRVIILDIRPTGNGEAEVTLVDEAANEMYVAPAPEGFIYIADGDGVDLADPDGELLYEEAA